MRDTPQLAASIHSIRSDLRVRTDCLLRISPDCAVSHAETPTQVIAPDYGKGYSAWVSALSLSLSLPCSLPCAGWPSIALHLSVHSKRRDCKVPEYDWGRLDPDAGEDVRQPQQCVCRTPWSQNILGPVEELKPGVVPGRYTFPLGGCHNPDGDVRPWCFTLNDCGRLQGNGMAYSMCVNHCSFNYNRTTGEIIPGSAHGCPTQVYCRTNTTVPKPIPNFQVRTQCALYTTHKAQHFCIALLRYMQLRWRDSLRCRNVQDVYGTLHESCFGIDYGIKEPCLCGHNCINAFIGALVLFCVCCCGRCITHQHTRYAAKHAPSLGLAVAVESYWPDRTCADTPTCAFRSQRQWHSRGSLQGFTNGFCNWKSRSQLPILRPSQDDHSNSGAEGRGGGGAAEGRAGQAVVGSPEDAGDSCSQSSSRHLTPPWRSRTVSSCLELAEIGSLMLMRSAAVFRSRRRDGHSAAPPPI